MRKNLFLAFFLILSTTFFCQDKKKAFKDGEKLQYKMSYSGFLRAGTAVLEIEETTHNGKKVFHTKGTGQTSTVVSWFFGVDDTYESYFDKDSIKPYFFKRKINEGGYKKHVNTNFNYSTNKAYVLDFIKQKDTSITFSKVQDMLSSFYYLRNQNVSALKEGESIAIDMFLDAQVYPFKLKYLGKGNVKTKFGNINCLIFRPFVQSGRIFKAQESVTIWITNDENKIPIKMKASLSVGSLRAELESYENLAHPFKKE